MSDHSFYSSSERFAVRLHLFTVLDRVFEITMSEDSSFKMHINYDR